MKTTHAERGGVALCDSRIRVDDDGHEVNCRECLRSIAKVTPWGAIELDDDPSRFTSPNLGGFR